MRLEAKPQPWLNDNTRTARQVRRRAEHKWKKDKLQVFYEILKNSLSIYMKTVRKEKSKYFKDIISKNAHSPCVLNVPISTCTDISSVTCDKFLLTRFMLLELLSLSLPTTPLYLSPGQQLLASLAPSLSPLLRDTISRMKFTAYPSDFVPPKI